MSNRFKKQGQRFLIVSGLALLTAACTGITAYKEPVTTVPETWSTSVTATAQEMDLAQWWQTFGDPHLEELMAEAHANNLDLKEAMSRLEESRIELGLSKSDRWPTIGAEVSGLRQGTSAGQFFPGATYNTYRLSVPISWDIDLFGRIKNQILAAQRDFEAEREDFASVMIRLYADVAVTHFEIQQVGQQIAVLKDNIAAIERATSLARSRAKHGLATGLEVAQAEELLATTQAGMPALLTTQQRLQHRQAVLLGKAPQGYQAPSLTSAVPPLPLFTADIARSPVDLLRQRPDIRAAERELAAQHARANVARAERFPKLSISALLGRESLSLGDLFDSGSGIWNLGASLSQSLFQGGRLRRQVQLEDARVQTALIAYEKTVLLSLEEVENALVNYHGLVAEQKQLQKALHATETSLKRATRLHKEGLTDFEDLLNTRRRQLQVQDQLAVVQGNTAVGLVQLYLALGGGWDPDQEPPATTPPATPSR